jgi:hypothetical protein
VTDDLAQLRELRAKVTKPVRVMFVMSLLNGRAMAAGQKTAANEIIALAGAVNAIDGYDGYKIISDEAIVAAKPDVVLSIQRGKDSVDAEAVYVHPAFALTPVAANKTFISMKASICSASGRARPPQRVTSRSSSIRRWRRRPRNSSRPRSPQTAGCDGPLRQRGTCEAAQRIRVPSTRLPHRHLLLAALAAAALIALTMGAAGIPLARLPAALGLWADAAAGPSLARDQLVLWSIRIPRIAAAAMVGALLAAAGAIMQGLFRNPLADPPGRRFLRRRVRSGGGDRLHRQPDRQSFRFMQNQLLPIAAFAGSLGRRSSSIRSRAARGGRRSRSSCWPALRLPPSPMPASGSSSSSPTIASCATSRSGCWAR